MKRLPPIEPVAGEVCETLRANGVEAILVGGAVVTLYSANEYQSMDLDFVVREEREGLRNTWMGGMMGVTCIQH